jgi:hypothetical protein
VSAILRPVFQLGQNERPRTAFCERPVDQGGAATETPMTPKFLAFCCAAAALAASASFAQTPSLAAGGRDVNGVQRQSGSKPAAARALRDDQLLPRGTANTTDYAATATVGQSNTTSANSHWDRGPDLSLATGVPAFDDPSLPSNGGGVIPDSVRRSYAAAGTPLGGDVAVSVHDYGPAAPISPAQAELNRLGLSGTPKP